jgi:hypothetical protein
VLPYGYPRPASNSFAFALRAFAHLPVSATFPLLPCYTRSLFRLRAVFSKRNISPIGIKYQTPRLIWFQSNRPEAGFFVFHLFFSNQLIVNYFLPPIAADLARSAKSLIFGTHSAIQNPKSLRIRPLMRPFFCDELKIGDLQAEYLYIPFFKI